jgi:hypothetical protein
MMSKAFGNSMEVGLVQRTGHCRLPARAVHRGIRVSGTVRQVRRAVREIQMRRLRYPIAVFDRFD